MGGPQPTGEERDVKPLALQALATTAAVLVAWHLVGRPPVELSLMVAAVTSFVFVWRPHVRRHRAVTAHSDVVGLDRSEAARGMPSDAVAAAAVGGVVVAVVAVTLTAVG